MAKKTLTKVGFWHAIRDIVVASIDKGQAPFVLVALIVLVLVSRLPADVLGRVTELVVSNFVNTALVGWLLVFLLTASWALHARRMRQRFHREIERVTSERNRLQQQQVGKQKVTSSRRSRK